MNNKQKNFRARALAAAASVLVLALMGCSGEGGGSSLSVTIPRVPHAPDIHLPANADPWVLSTSDLNSASHVYLGNGYAGFQAGPLGNGTGKAGDLSCLVAGAYRNGALRSLPSPAAYTLSLGRDLLSGPGPAIAGWHQTLNLQDGILNTYFTWRTTDQGVPVTVTTFADRADPHVVVVHIDAPPGTNLSAAHTLSGPTSGAATSFTNTTSGSTASPGTASPGTASLGTASLGTASPGTGSGGSQTSGASEYLDTAASPGSPGIAMVAGQVRAPGSAFDWTGYTVIYTTEDGPDPAALAREKLRTLTTASYPRLLAAHVAAWHDLWRSDISISGDAASQQIVHAALFYLLESTRAGSRWSIPPMGLSNGAWGGHIFWDAEIWMFPALALLYPAEARPLVDYRVRLLPAARELARAEGKQGASYPWESAATGREVASPPYTLERHVTADVANMVWWYYLVTGDRAWLRSSGYPVLAATADYWVSRVSPGKDGKLHIRQVIGPDEAAGLVDDDAFTNGAAKVALLSADSAARELGLPANPAWSRTAARLDLPRDPSTGRYLTYADYHGEVMKQADPCLLIYPLALVNDAPTIRKMLAYYPGRITPTGPAMTESIYATIAARQGDTAAAFRFFRHSYEPYLVPSFDQVSEKHSYTRRYCFVTGSGGLLQSVLYGFGGLQIGGSELGARPHLPSGWKKLEITNLHYRGRVYHLTATPTATTLVGG